MHILRWMGSKSCVKFQRCPLKFHTKFWTHTPQNMHFTDCYFSLWFTISWNCDVISLSETAPWNITPNLMVFSYDKVLIFRRFQLYQWSRVDRIWSQQSSWPFYRLVGVVYKWYSCEIIGWKYFASSGWNWRHYGYKNDLSSHMFYYTPLLRHIDRCYHSWAAVTPVKYGHDIQKVNNDLMILNLWKNNWTWGIG